MEYFKTFSVFLQIHNTHGAYILWFSHSYFARSKQGHSIREIKNNRILHALAQNARAQGATGWGGGGGRGGDWDLTPCRTKRFNLANLYCVKLLLVFSCISSSQTGVQETEAFEVPVLKTDTSGMKFQNFIYKNIMNCFLTKFSDLPPMQDVLLLFTGFSLCLVHCYLYKEIISSVNRMIFYCRYHKRYPSNLFL
jgi:hypothetical protein